MNPNQGEDMRLSREIGREGLRRYILAARFIADDAWPPVLEGAIEGARKRYDAGFCELAQNRVGGMVIQYEFPRKFRAHRKTPWFAMQTEPAAPVPDARQAKPKEQ